MKMNWYYISNDKKFGPITSSEVRDYIATRVNPTDRFLGPGMTYWVFGSEVEAIINGDDFLPSSPNVAEGSGDLEKNSRESALPFAASEVGDRTGNLSNVIKGIAWLNLAAGLTLIIIGLSSAEGYLVVGGAVCLLTTPFLYGFGDIIFSLRAIAQQTRNLSGK